LIIILTFFAQWNVDFAAIFAVLTLKQINEWETFFLCGIQFNVAVTASEYTKLYFKIRQFHKQAKLQLGPLRKERATRLEALSTTALKKLQQKNKSAKKGSKRRSQTMDPESTPSSHAILN